MAKLSVVIVAKNEEENIRQCLDSVKWADEIIVVDAKSTDKTVEIAREYTDKVFIKEDPKSKIGLAEISKNFGIDKATGDWIMVLDADEIVTPELRAEIEEVSREDGGRFDGYLVLRKNYFLGKWMKHGGWWGYASNVELVRRGKGRFPPHPHCPLKVDGKVGYLKNPVIHNCYKDISEFVGKMNLYTTLDASERRVKSSRGHILLLPPASFTRSFFLKMGYRDGLHGFIAAVFTAFYTFVKYAKLWEKQKSRSRHSQS